MVHRRELPGEHGRGAEVKDLARAHEVMQRAHRLFDRHVRVKGVDDQKVDIVGINPPQAGIDRAQDMLARQTLVVRGVAHRVIDLGRQNQLIARHKFQQGAGHNLFIDPQGIPVGHVVKGDPGLDRLSQQGARLGLVQHPRLPGAGAETHGAKAVFADLQTGIA